MTWGLVAAMGFLFIFAKVAEDLLGNELATFDTVVGNFIRGFSSPGLTKVAIAVTMLGEGGFETLVLIAAVTFFVRYLHHRSEALVLTLAIAGGWLLNSVLKWAFHRPRPEVEQLVGAGWYSFPSGHAMVGVAFYGVLGYLIWLNLRENELPAWYVPVLTVLVMLGIGLSRVYLGVHYPSDVVAGFAIGGTWGSVCVSSLHIIRYYHS